MEIEAIRLSNASQLEKYLGKSGTYFVLQGRLGNQLFGISDAYRLHKAFGTRIYVDLTEIYNSGFTADWLQSVNYEWLHLFKNVDLKSEIRKLKKTSLSDVRKLSNHSGKELFEGFSPKLKDIEQSGLFQRGIFPFEINQNFSSAIKKKIPYTALSFRLGDYASNPHLGILNVNYYYKALKALAIYEDFQIDYFLHSDDISLAKSLLENIGVRIKYIQEDQDPINNLYSLSRGKNLILSNSTFAFWSGYFSSAKVCYPEPFYVAMPNWHKQLFWKESIPIKHRRFSKSRYYLERLLSKLD